MIFCKLLISIFRFALNIRLLKNGVKYIITELYRSIAQDNLSLKTEIIKVKKGKARYTLVFLSTKELTTKVNIGRHYNPYTANFNSFSPINTQNKA